MIFSEDLVTGNNKGKSLAHNAAQYIHCLAQGKVGSGFDVSSAIFGSHIYRRFDPSVIAPLMDKASHPREGYHCPFISQQFAGFRNSSISGIIPLE